MSVKASLALSLSVSYPKVSRFSHQSPRVSVEICYASDGSCPLPRQEPEWSVQRCWDKQEVTRILRGNGLLTVAKRMGGSGRTVWELGGIVFCLICVWRKVTACMYIRNGDRESVWSFCRERLGQAGVLWISNVILKYLAKRGDSSSGRNLVCSCQLHQQPCLSVTPSHRLCCHSCSAQILLYCRRVSHSFWSIANTCSLLEGEGELFMVTPLTLTWSKKPRAKCLSLVAMAKGKSLS